MAISGTLKFLVLKVISSEEKNGISIIESIEKKTGWRVSYGSFYPLMKELTKSGLVTLNEKSKSKIYKITDKGKELIDNAEAKKNEIITKINEGVKFLEILGEKDIKKEMKSIIDKHLLDFIPITNEFTNMKRILSKKDISKKHREINRILRETNLKLEEL